MAFDPEGAWLCFGFSGVVFRSLCGLRDPTSLSGGDVFPQELLVFLCMSSSSVLPPRPSLHPLPPRLKDRAAFARRSSEAIPAGQFGENIRHGVSALNMHSNASWEFSVSERSAGLQVLHSVLFSTHYIHDGPSSHHV